MKEIWRGFVVLIFLMMVTGLIYPLLITGIGAVAFPHQTGGSLIDKEGTLLGSNLIGQNFMSPKYFWGRLSETMPAYNPLSSSGSNLGPLNPQLITNMKSQIALLQSTDPSQKAPVPIDLVTSSGSGLDPDISVSGAEYQASRVAKARGLSLAQVNALIQENMTPPQFGFMGQARVNVLNLNLALDQLKK